MGTNIIDKVKLAEWVAECAHKGQVDKSGVDYIEHSKKVASLVTEEKEKIVAYLHDVLEDTSSSRVITRAIETGRIIPSETVLGYGNGCDTAYEELKGMTGKNGKPYVREKQRFNA